VHAHQLAIDRERQATDTTRLHRRMPAAARLAQLRVVIAPSASGGNSDRGTTLLAPRARQYQDTQEQAVPTDAAAAPDSAKRTVIYFHSLSSPWAYLGGPGS
jgi:hypothetical protein